MTLLLTSKHPIMDIEGIELLVWKFAEADVGWLMGKQSKKWMENINPKARGTKLITFDYNKVLPYYWASDTWFGLSIKFVTVCWDWFCLLMLYRWMLYPLHSSITQEEQQRVFSVPPIGFRKVIVSTNIAESSITVPDIKYGNEKAYYFCFVVRKSVIFVSCSLVITDFFQAGVICSLIFWIFCGLFFQWLTSV